MPDAGSDSAWAELGNIDYLLDQLARAVDRGEVGRDVYDRLAPRYLERRAEIAGILERRSSRLHTPVVEPNGLVPGAVPPPRTAAEQQYVTPAFPPTAREPVRVNWTGVLTGVGALLVIVASAIFAIATWDLFSVEFRIGFLGALTAGFYVAAALVRSRLHLVVGSVALAAVGSAMLLFDGWIVIDGYGLEGPWPWVGWLAVCSAVYWLTEVRLTGRFFGAIGAAAQIAWVWLLGQGLGWSTGPRMAAIAVLAVGWALIGKAAEDSEPLASLAHVLRWAAPVAIVVGVVGLVGDLALAPAGWTQIGSALVVGAAASVVVRVSGFPPGIGALAGIPVFIAIASAVLSDGAAWGHVVVLAVLAVAYLLCELAWGGWGYGLAALFAEVGAWLALSSLYGWSDDVVVAVLAAVALSWLVASRLLESADRPRTDRWSGMPSAATLLAAGGLVLLILTTFLMPVAREALPLAGSTLEARDVALAGLLTAVWLAAALVRREPGVGVPVVVGMFYLGACLMAWLAPGWHSALYASTLLLLALVVLVVRRPVGELLRLSEAGIAIAMRLAAVTVMTVGLGAQAALFELRSWQTAVLLGVSAVFWITDALLAEKHRPGLLPGSALLVFAAGSLAWWVTAPHATGGEVALAAALTGTLIATSALFLRSAEGWRAPWPLGAGLASTFMCVVALEAPGPLAISLALTTVTWAITAFTFESELAFAAAVTALLGVLATLAWADGPAWASVVALLGASAAMLAPSVLMSAGLSDRRARAVRALACAGVGGPLLLLALRFPSAVGLPIADWVRIGEQGTVVALLGLGAYGVVAGVLHRFEPAIYAGGGALVLACWAQIAALDVSGVAPYGLVLAIYIAWVGSHWASVNDVAPPLVADIFSALVALVPSAVAAVAVSGAYNAWPDLLWAVAIALAAIGLGVALKVRSYFFGGSAALVFVALARSWIYLAQFWWLVLGIIGVAMLVIALTWERQQRLLSSARDRVEDTFEGWR